MLAFRRAAEAAGAVVREAAGVLDLERKGEQWHVSCSDGSVHSAPVLVNTADVVRSAGLTPVILFSAHTYNLDVARAAGFRDLIMKRLG